MKRESKTFIFKIIIRKIMSKISQVEKKKCLKKSPNPEKEEGVLLFNLEKYNRENPTPTEIIKGVKKN